MEYLCGREKILEDVVVDLDYDFVNLRELGTWAAGRYRGCADEEAMY